MANDFNSFNYDGNDPQLDENGLPIYTDDEESEGADSSSQDLMDMIRKARGEENEDDEGDNDKDDPDKPDKEDNQNDTDKDSDNKPSKDEGGRYGDNPPQQKSNLTKDKPSTPQPEKGGGSNWFSKLTGGGKEAGKQMAQQAGKEAGKQAAKQAGAAAAKAGGSAASGALAAALPYIGIALLIIIAIIIVVVAISSIVAFLQDKTDPENMTSNAYVTNEYFYGIRVSYIDEQALADSLQLSYKQYAVDVFENIETNNPNITINITLPEEGFNNTTQVDQHITNISLAMANIVATGNSEYQNIEFSTLYPQIEYFGLTSNQGTVTKDFLIDYITDNNLITIGDGDLSSIISNALTTPPLQYIYNRCEKVMIKDEIASESGLTDIAQRKYVGSVYMPNKDIVITSSIITVSNEYADCTNNIAIVEEKNGSQNILKEKEITDNIDVVTGFEIGDVELKKFISIDSDNLEKFSAGISLFEAVKLNSNYFTLTQDNIYTWKPTDTSLYYITFKCNTQFIFGDFDLNVKLP